MAKSFNRIFWGLILPDIAIIFASIQLNSLLPKVEGLRGFIILLAVIISALISKHYVEN